jgi:glycerate 2-kinase
VNSSSLIFAEYPGHIQALISAALDAVDPQKAVQRNLNLDGTGLTVGNVDFALGQGSIFLVGAGKASRSMGLATMQILGDLVVEGILISKDAGEESSRSAQELNSYDQISVFEASHPVSDIRGVEATDAIISMLSRTTENDLVLCLISGGASALLTRPVIPLEDWQHLVKVLLDSGCSINELNSVRRQLDSVKGGGLLEFAAPASCISLILSDVVGNPLEVIGSGPTVVIDESPQVARRILKRYGVRESVPDEVWIRLDESLNKVEENEVVDRPRPCNHILGDVCQAAAAAQEAASKLGFSTQVLTCHLEGEAREVGKIAASLAKDAPPGTCLILGGETTVTVKGDGLGGRNQEVALSAAISVDSVENVVVASFATDGEDGPTTSAGAIVTGSTLPVARNANLDPLQYLANNDSNTFFEHVGGLINTGSTGTNVNDLIFILRYRA